MDAKFGGLAFKIKELLRKILRVLLYVFIAYIAVVAIVIWFSGDDDYNGDCTNTSSPT